MRRGDKDTAVPTTRASCWLTREPGSTFPAWEENLIGASIYRILRTFENNYNLAFGFRRLSIQDLSIHGHQPMSDREQRF